MKVNDNDSRGEHDLLCKAVNTITLNTLLSDLTVDLDPHHETILNLMQQYKSV